MTAEAVGQAPARRWTIPRVVSVAVTAGVAVLAVATLLSFLGAYRFAFDLLAHFRLHFAIAAVGAAALLLAARWRRAGVLAAVVAAANLAGLAPLFAGSPARAVPAGETLSLTTFNIWARNRDWSAIAHEIEDSGADLVVLQEVSRTAQPLLSALSGRYPHQLHCLSIAYCDVALLSRRPWTAAGRRRPGATRAPLVWARFGGPRDAVTVATTHLDRPPSRRHQGQLADLARWTSEQRTPLVLAGDFNATPWSYALTRFSRDGSVAAVPGLRPTWPAHIGFAQLPIDHVFVSPGIAAVGARRGAAAGSDHLPVTVDLVLPANR